LIGEGGGEGSGGQGKENQLQKPVEKAPVIRGRWAGDSPASLGLEKDCKKNPTKKKKKSDRRRKESKKSASRGGEGS